MRPGPGLLGLLAGLALAGAVWGTAGLLGFVVLAVVVVAVILGIALLGRPVRPEIPPRRGGHRR